MALPAPTNDCLQVLLNSLNKINCISLNDCSYAERDYNEAAYCVIFTGQLRIINFLGCCWKHCNGEEAGLEQVFQSQTYG